VYGELWAPSPVAKLPRWTISPCIWFGSRNRGQRFLEKLFLLAFIVRLQNIVIAVRARQLIGIVLVVSLSFTTAGCGAGDEWTAKRPKVYRAQGVVKLDGKPLEEATVIYHSQSNDVSAQGVTDKSGNFTLTTYDANDGAVEGKHKVVITKRTYEKRKTKYDSPEESSIALIPKELLPTKYALPKTTTVEVEVLGKGTNNATIEITSK